MSDPEVPWAALFAITSVPMSVIDTSGRLVAANDAFASLVGHGPGDVTELDVERITRPADRAWTRRYLARMWSGEIDRFETDKYLVRADGRLVLTRLSLRALGDDDGRCTHVVAAHVALPDDLRLAEPGVADRLLEFGSETITLVDPDGRVRVTRGAQVPVQGYPTTFWRGRNVSEVLVPGEWERLYEFREEVADSPGSMMEVDVEVMAGDGEVRTVAARVFNCVDDPLLAGFVIVTRDITEERAVMAELAQRRRTAEAIVDAQTRLLATVSHELRNPLHAVHGLAELLAAEELPSEASGLAGSLVRQLASLSRVTEDLLDAARLDAGEVAMELVPTDLHALVRDVVDLGRAAAGARPVNVTSRRSHGLPEWILVDPGRLRQVLVNLVGNAVKFTERGSVQLVVRTDGDDGLSFSVIDTGVGIPDAEQAAILQPFAVGSTAGSARGAGLGLSIVQRLVDAMDGKVELTSTVGVGTRFDVTIPLRSSAPPSAVDHPEPSHDLRVLVVEDNPVNQQLARRQLTRLGFEPVVATTGEEGYELLVDAGPGGFDVVLMDQQLPGWSGTETTTRIRALDGPLGRIPVVGVSASTTGADREAFLAAGMDDLVAKPATLQDLSSAIRAVCGIRTAAPAEPAEPAGPDAGDGSTAVPGRPEDGSSPIDEAVLDRLATELGETDAVVQLVTTFLGELDGRVRGIVEADDDAVARRVAHTLKSSARLLGADELADTCLGVERGALPASVVVEPAEQVRAAYERWLERHHR